MHRDLKPANVFLTENGRAKVGDFGIAIDAETPERIRLQCMGSLSYMAPEQLLGKPPDAQVDLFALGVILYELMGGFPLKQHTIATQSEIRRRIMELWEQEQLPMILGKKLIKLPETWGGATLAYQQEPEKLRTLLRAGMTNSARLLPGVEQMIVRMIAPLDWRYHSIDEVATEHQKLWQQLTRRESRRTPEILPLEERKRGTITVPKKETVKPYTAAQSPNLDETIAGRVFVPLERGLRKWGRRTKDRIGEFGSAIGEYGKEGAICTAVFVIGAGYGIGKWTIQGFGGGAQWGWRQRKYLASAALGLAVLGGGYYGFNHWPREESEQPRIAAAQPKKEHPALPDPQLLKKRTVEFISTYTAHTFLTENDRAELEQLIKQGEDLEKETHESVVYAAEIQRREGISPEHRTMLTGMEEQYAILGKLTETNRERVEQFHATVTMAAQQYRQSDAMGEAAVRQTMEGKAQRINADIELPRTVLLNLPPSAATAQATSLEERIARDITRFDETMLPQIVRAEQELGQITEQYQQLTKGTIDHTGRLRLDELLSKAKGISYPEEAAEERTAKRQALGKNIRNTIQKYDRSIAETLATLQEKLQHYQQGTVGSVAELQQYETAAQQLQLPPTMQEQRGTLQELVTEFTTEVQYAKFRDVQQQVKGGNTKTAQTDIQLIANILETHKLQSDHAQRLLEEVKGYRYHETTSYQVAEYKTRKKQIARRVFAGMLFGALGPFAIQPGGDILDGGDHSKRLVEIGQYTREYEVNPYSGSRTLIGDTAPQSLKAEIASNQKRYSITEARQ